MDRPCEHAIFAAENIRKALETNRVWFSSNGLEEPASIECAICKKYYQVTDQFNFLACINCGRHNPDPDKSPLCGECCIICGALKPHTTQQGRPWLSRYCKDHDPLHWERG